MPRKFAKWKKTLTFPDKIGGSDKRRTKAKHTKLPEKERLKFARARFRYVLFEMKLDQLEQELDIKKIQPDSTIPKQDESAPEETK